MDNSKIAETIINSGKVSFGLSSDAATNFNEITKADLSNEELISLSAFLMAKLARAEATIKNDREHFREAEPFVFQAKLLARIAESTDVDGIELSNWSELILDERLALFLASEEPDFNLEEYLRTKPKLDNSVFEAAIALIKANHTKVTKKAAEAKKANDPVQAALLEVKDIWKKWQSPQEVGEKFASLADFARKMQSRFPVITDIETIKKNERKWRAKAKEQASAS